MHPMKYADVAKTFLGVLNPFGKPPKYISPYSMFNGSVLKLELENRKS